MKIFNKFLKNVTEKPDSENTDPRGKCSSDTARDLATLHHICVSHLKELQALSKTQVNLSIFKNLESFY